MAKINRDDFIAALKEMTILEIKDLVDAMKDEFGIDPTAVAAAAPAAGGAAEAEDTKVSVFIANPGAGKIGVIKVVREVTGLGLKEAKAAVEDPKIAIKENIEAAEAAELKAKLEEAGATVEVK